MGTQGVYLGDYDHIHVYSSFKSSPHPGKAAAGYDVIVGDHVQSYSIYCVIYYGANAATEGYSDGLDPAIGVDNEGWMMYR